MLCRFVYTKKNTHTREKSEKRQPTDQRTKPKGKDKKVRDKDRSEKAV